MLMLMMWMLVPQLLRFRGGEYGVGEEIDNVGGDPAAARTKLGGQMENEPTKKGHKKARKNSTMHPAGGQQEGGRAPKWKKWQCLITSERSAGDVP